MSWLDFIFEQSKAGEYSYPHQTDTEKLTLLDWRLLSNQYSTSWEVPVERAIIDGYCSQSVGFAFASGYQSALRRLVPALDHQSFIAFCVTEAGGNSPSAIASRLDETEKGRWSLNGEKSFITGAKEAQKLLVAASVGEKEGRNQLKMTLLDTATAGVDIQCMKEMPFIPEISHGTATFTDVELSGAQILEGDAYINYVKPFRTIEDIHVFAALYGYLFKISLQYEFPHAVSQRILNVLISHVQLASMEPLNPGVHIALAGAQQEALDMAASIDEHLAAAPALIRDQWARDKMLLGVASKAREKRLITAWKIFAS